MTDLHGVEEEVRPPRTAIFPVVAIPAPAAALAGYVLVASGVIATAAAAVLALTYRVPRPIATSGFPTERVIQPRLTAVDRVHLLAQGAGTLTAVLLLLGAVLLVVADRSDDGGDPWRTRALWVAAAVAAVVLVANATLVWELVVKAGGTFVAQQLADRLASIVELLAPIAVSAGVLLYVVLYLTSDRGGQPRAPA